MRIVEVHIFTRSPGSFEATIIGETQRRTFSYQSNDIGQKIRALVTANALAVRLTIDDAGVVVAAEAVPE